MNQKIRTQAGSPLIIAPVKCTEDILPILQAGAREVYGGVLDPAWEEDFGHYVEMNRRSAFGSKANLVGCDALREAVRICAGAGAEFHLTLNALQIPQRYHGYIQPILEQFAEAGGKKVIISDLTLLPLVLQFRLHPVISSCADAMNTAAVRFYQSQHCQRIIFPRYMLLEDMETITAVIPELEYEAFLMNGACRFHDGCCLCMHGTVQKGLCDSLDYSPYSVSTDAGIQTLEIAARQHERFKQSYYRACGLCALFRLSRCVDSLKIVGRNAELNGILSDIQLAKRNIEIALECENEETYLKNMLRPKDAVIRCRDHRNCYYLL